MRNRLGLRSIALFVAFASAALAGGCQGQLSKVEGIVMLDGKPLEGATVTFVPEGGRGRSASGLTGSDGVFHLTTFNTGDGALPGTYKVTVTLHEALAGAGTTDTGDREAMKNMMMDAMKKKKGETAAKSKPKPSPIPKAYHEVRTTPLKYEVPAQGRLTVELRSTGGS
jgi:hypothetical protein